MSDNATKRAYAINSTSHRTLAKLAKREITRPGMTKALIALRLMMGNRGGLVVGK